MKQIKKIPLAQRLRQAGAKQPAPCFLHIYRLFLDTYFNGLAEMAGDDRVRTDILEGSLRPYVSKYGEMPLLVEFVTESMDLPRWELGELLYQVLVKPFAAIKEGGTDI